MSKLKSKILVLLFIPFLLFIFNINKEETIDIDKILKTSDYVYLPEEAKEYIEKVYKETGQILLTERNKIDNLPYLNNEYIEYLNNLETGDIDYDIIPNETVVDYIYNSSIDLSNIQLPTSFDLRNVDGKNYVTPIKNQKSTGLCWSFATNAQAESYLLVKNKLSYEKGVSKLFSEMQIDYATAGNGIKDGNTLYSFNRILGDGGNFKYATSVMMDSLGLVDVSWKNFDEYDSLPMEKNKVYKFENSLYEVTRTIDYPKLNLNELDLTKEDDKLKRDSYLNDLKKLIMENGGAYVGTVDPTSRCSILVNGYRLMYDDGKCASGGHAMQIIGWDDNFEYSFCSGEKDDKNYYYLGDSSKCTTGKVVTGKGAWLIKNSWGTRLPYVYLAYDSMDSDINMITDLVTKDWDNYEKLTKQNNGIFSYNSKFNKEEKLNKIKFHTDSQFVDYEICVGKNTLDNCKTGSITYPGIYTVEFDNVIIEDNIQFKILGSKNIYLDNVTIYTNSIDLEPILSTEDLYYENTLTDVNKYVFRISSKTKNIDENEIIAYKILDKNRNEISSNYTYSENIVYANEVFSKLLIDSNLPLGTYILQTIYNGQVMDESNLVVENKIIVTEGSGTESDPYIINTPGQLNLIRLDRFAFYKLGQDIDLTYDTQDENGLFYNDGKGWEPIRYSSYSNNSSHYLYFSKGFSGGFDGNNHKIIGLYINRPDEDGIGLFANTYNENYSNLHIKDLTLVNPIVIGKNYVGSLLGAINGTTYERQLNVSNIQVIGGSIKGNDYVGGLIGVANVGSDLNIYGTSIQRHLLSNLYNSATVLSNNHAGGIFGLVANINSYGSRSPIKISNILNKGKVEGLNASGLFGYMITRSNNSITVNNSMNTGKILGENCSNDIVCTLGDLSGTIYMNNIYYTNNSSLDNRIVINNVSKKSISDLKSINNYWTDFSNDWKIETIDNITRLPILKFMDFDYTNIDDITLGVGLKININDLINPKLEAAKNISYELDTSIISISNNEIIGENVGEGTIKIISNYDGYEKDVNVVVYSNKYTISFNSNGGSIVNNITQDYNTTVTKPSDPTKKGYVFAGWYKDSELKEEYTFDKMPSENILLYAKWKSLNVVINEYNINDNKISNITNGININNYLKNIIFDNLTVKFYSHKNELITDYNKLVGTGSKVKFYSGDVLIKEYTNIVKSDITSDGLVNLADLSKLFNYYRGNITMNDIDLLAADVTDDNKVNLSDLAKLFNYYRGNIKEI